MIMMITPLDLDLGIHTNKLLSNQRIANRTISHNLATTGARLPQRRAQNYLGC
jgi:hypothetical protein